jgi:metallo-beta-lactamase class B
MKLLRRATVLILISLSASTTRSQQLRPLINFDTTWVQEFTPFRIVGNLYYVGTRDLACYLIHTPKGLILINTGLPGSDTMIRRHVEMLGFNYQDIKIILASHAHFDHAGGIAAVKKATGAKVMIGIRDADVLADGGNSDFDFGGKGYMFAPVKADRWLKDRDTINFGGMHILVLAHPGHTKGSLSFLVRVKDSARSYRVAIVNIPSILSETQFPSMPTYPNVAADYAYTLKAMKALHFDIWLSSHASQFGLEDKWNPGDGYHPQAFIDQAGYDEIMKEKQALYDKKMAPYMPSTLK